MTQNLYQYTAILAKDKLTQGKVTYVDKRSQNAVVGLPLDSECKTGQVLAPNSEQARERAIEQLKSRYPHELGWRNHENVTVAMTPETIIEAEPLVIPAPRARKF